MFFVRLLIPLDVFLTLSISLELGCLFSGSVLCCKGGLFSTHRRQLVLSATGVGWLSSSCVVCHMCLCVCVIDLCVINICVLLMYVYC